MTMKYDNSKPIGFSKSSFKKEVYKSYLKKQEKNQINNLTVHLKQLENNWKKKKKSTKISRRKEIIKIQAEINEKEMKETIVKINKTKSLFFEKINKIDKHLARLIKKKREKNQLNKIINETEAVTTDNTEIQRIILRGGGVGLRSRKPRSVHQVPGAETGPE